MKTIFYRLILALACLSLALLSGGCAYWTSWTRTIAKENFNSYGKQMPTIQTDSSLYWSVAKKVGRFTGVSSDTLWEGNHVVLPIEKDNRVFLELSGEFMVKRSMGYQFIGLWGMTGIEGEEETRGPLGICFEGKEGKGKYKSVTKWVKLPVSKDVIMSGLGDETSGFHEMRMLLDRENSTIQYFVDEKKVGTVRFSGEFPQITKMQIGIETPTAGTMLDIRFDNLCAKSWGDKYKFTAQ